jgi:hypothetical protein
MHRYAILICILKCCFLVELFEKWRSVLPLPPVARLTWATHLGILATQLGVSQRVKAPNQDVTQGEGGLGSPLAGFPSNTKN